MDLITYLVNNEDTLTESELKVHNYIIENQAELETITISALSERCYVSRATTDRYLKKVGVNGFKQFKIKLAEFNLQNEELNAEFIKIIKEHKNKRIAILGLGSSYISALYLDRRLTILGYNVKASTISDIIGNSILAELVIIISNSGNASYYHDIMNFNGNCKFIAITRKDSQLSYMVDSFIANNIKFNKNNKFDHECQVKNINIVEDIFNELI